MGRMFGSLVGSSEENVRRAISVAESVAPAILWVDEIDKAFAGSQQLRRRGWWHGGPRVSARSSPGFRRRARPFLWWRRRTTSRSCRPNCCGRVASMRSSSSICRRLEERAEEIFRSSPRDDEVATPERFDHRGDGGGEPWISAARKIEEAIHQRALRRRSMAGKNCRTAHVLDLCWPRRCRWRARWTSRFNGSVAIVGGWPGAQRERAARRAEFGILVGAKDGRRTVMWKSFQEHFKECGRHSGGFFLLGLLGAPLCAAMVSMLGPWTANLLWVTWAVLFAHGFVKFVHQWRHPVRLEDCLPCRDTICG